MLLAVYLINLWNTKASCISNKTEQSRTTARYAGCIKCKPGAWNFEQLLSFEIVEDDVRHSAMKKETKDNEFKLDIAAWLYNYTYTFILLIRDLSCFIADGYYLIGNYEAKISTSSKRIASYAYFITRKYFTRADDNILPRLLIKWRSRNTWMFCLANQSLTNRELFVVHLQGISVSEFIKPNCLR